MPEPTDGAELAENWDFIYTSFDSDDVAGIECPICLEEFETTEAGVILSELLFRDPAEKQFYADKYGDNFSRL